MVKSKYDDSDDLRNGDSQQPSERIRVSSSDLLNGKEISIMRGIFEEEIAGVDTEIRENLERAEKELKSTGPESKRRKESLARYVAGLEVLSSGKYLCVLMRPYLTTSHEVFEKTRQSLIAGGIRAFWKGIEAEINRRGRLASYWLVADLALDHNMSSSTEYRDLYYLRREWSALLGGGQVSVSREGLLVLPSEAKEAVQEALHGSSN